MPAEKRYAVVDREYFPLYELEDEDYDEDTPGVVIPEGVVARYTAAMDEFRSVQAQMKEYSLLYRPPVPKAPRPLGGNYRYEVTLVMKEEGN